MNPENKKILIGIVIVAVIIAGYFLLIMPDQRTPTQKLGDAIHDLDKGPDKAARQLENRTPGQKVGDAIEDAGENVKKSTAAPNQ